MRAISVFSRETGTSTRWCLAAAALRRRVRKSAMGSVCIILLPARFHDAGDFALQRHTAKTEDRKSTRLNSSHSQISYAVFCLKKKKQNRNLARQTQHEQ